MSKKTVAFARKVGQVGGTAEGRAKLIPSRVVMGDGDYLKNVNTLSQRAPHGTRGMGNVCSRPMSAEKSRRLVGK